MTERIRLTDVVVVEGADRHPHAARRLRSSLPGEFVDTRQSVPDGTLVIQLNASANRPEGGFAIRANGGESPVIEIEGGPFSGVIYGVEELIQNQLASDGTIPVGTVEQEPGLPYRTFWNWDHTTNWNMSQIGAQEIGVMNPYSKPPDGFLADFKRVVDFMSANRIAALTIYGFLRDSHGGIEVAQELCKYATERGVRILPGIAINAYGGVVWDMEHEYNLATWLRKHPELAAEMEFPTGFQLKDLAFPLFFPRNDFSARGCSSKLANQRWMEDGVAWLTETFEIGGINIEAGDYGVCGCPDCQIRRAEREDASRRQGYAESWSHSDMADFFPGLLGIAKARRPDAWIYSEIQWDNLLDAEAQKPLATLPKGGIYQHTVNRSYWNKVDREITPEYARSVPTEINVLRTQFCCQWNGDYRTERYHLNARMFADQAKKVAQIGFKGLAVWGEASPYHASTEISYLAFARFSWNPNLTWDEFIHNDVAPLLGGEDAANRYVYLAETLDRTADLEIGQLSRIRSEALSNAAGSAGEVSRRWLWLADQAARRSYDQSTLPPGSAW